MENHFRKTIHKVGIITKRSIAANKKDYIEEVISFIAARKKQVFLDSNMGHALKSAEAFKKTQLLKQCDLVIVFGGDGTLLKTARRLDRRKTLVLSVNMGTLGFLTECSPEKIFEALDSIFCNKYQVDRRSLLRVTIYRNKKKTESFLALNDAVINQGSFARLIQLRMEINQRKMVTFKADGVIIATPTGSTAHSLSAGGPIIHPAIEGMVITPICPSSMTVRPIVIPQDRQLKITIETERRDGCVSLTLDGQETFDLEYGDEIKIRKSSRYFYLARIFSHGYYKMLRDKLHWGGE